MPVYIVAQFSLTFTYLQQVYRENMEMRKILQLYKLLKINIKKKKNLCVCVCVCVKYQTTFIFEILY